MKIKIDISKEMLVRHYNEVSTFGKLIFNEKIGDVDTFIFEGYTFRNNNFYTKTIMIYEENYQVYMHVIVAGTAAGLLQIDMGAKKSRYNSFLKNLDVLEVKYEVIEK